MEPADADADLAMADVEKPVSAEAPELTVEGTTTVAAVAVNGSEDTSLANHGVLAATGVKRAAVDAAGTDVVVGGEQPLEPVAKKPRADEHATDGCNAEPPSEDTLAAAEQPEHPAASLQDDAAVAQSPSKARPSPAPSTARSPAARRVGDVVLRVLVLDRSVATIIGKGGATVKAIQNSSGARVQAMPPVPGVEERVVVLSNPEDQQQIISGAEKALHAIQRKLVLELEPSAAAVLDKVQQELAPQPAAEFAAGQSTAEAHTATTAQSEALAREAEPMATGVGASEATADASATAPQAAEAGEGSSAPAAIDVTLAVTAAESSPAVVDTTQPTAAPAAEADATQPAASLAAAAAASDEEQPTVADAEQPGTAGAEQATTMDSEQPAALDVAQAAAADAGQPADAAAAAGTAAAASAAGTAAEDTEQATSAAKGREQATEAEHVSVAVPAVSAEEPAAAGTEQPAAAAALQHQAPAAQTPPISPATKSTSAIIPALGGGSPPPPRPVRSVQHVARMLVSHSQANSLLTAGAAGLRSIKDQSGAFVKVLQADESPFCALEGDRVAQVVGTAEQVFRAVILLGGHLRKHPAIERPGGLHPGLAARVGGGRMYGGRGHRSPPPPPPPRAAYGAAYGHPGYGVPPPGYGPPVHAYGAPAAYGAPTGHPGYRPPPAAYGVPPPGTYDQMYPGAYGY